MSKKEFDKIEEPLLKTAQKKEMVKDHNFLFTKLTTLIKTIYKNQFQVQNDQIYPFVSENTSAELIIDKFEAFQKQRNFKFGMMSLLFHMTGKYYFLALLCYIVNVAQQLGQVQILNIITDELKKYNSYDQNNLLKLILLMSAQILLGLYGSYLQIRADWNQLLWKIQTKTTIQFYLYNKALRTKQFNTKNNNQKQKGQEKEKKQNEEKKDENKIKDKKKEKQEEEEVQEDPDINNLMTVDVDILLNMYWSTASLFVSIIQIAVVLFMIYQQIGSAIYNGFFVIVGALIFNLIVAKIMQIAFKNMMKEKDKRVALSTDIIEGMKSIKYLCWEIIFNKKIQEIRKREYFNLLIARIGDGFLVVFWNSISYFMLFAFLLNYTNMGHSLLEANIFVIIALFQQLTYPLGVLPWSVNTIFKTRVSFMRIKRYINEKEIEESDVDIIDPLDQSKQLQSFTNDSSLYSFNNSNQINQNERTVIEIFNSQFKWPKRQMLDNKKNKQNSNIKSINKDEIQVEIVEDLKVQEQNDSDFTLSIIEISIKANKITFVIGRVGSGKTAFLQAIMNEMENNFNKDKIGQKFSEFESQVNSENIKLQSINSLRKNIIVKGSIAYVSQNHWLQNKSIKDNICFGKDYDEQWYQTCIRVCQLEQDLKSFPNRDKKLISQGGVNLSGGQRQRVALARAIYQNSDIYLLDDIFSSLDAHVADAIFENALKGILIKNGKTVVLVTSHYKYLKESQTNIIYLNKGVPIQDQMTINQYLNRELQKQASKEEKEKKKKKDENVILFDELLLDAEAMILKKKLSSKQYHKNISDKKNNKDQEEKDELEEEKNEEYRDQGSISSQTFYAYFKACWFPMLSVMIFTNFLMQGSRSLIDFWLKSEVSPNHTQFFDWIDGLFDNNFGKIFTYLILLNLFITAIRAISYGICSMLAARTMFNRLNKSIIYSNMTFFDQNPTGRIINRLSSDVSIVDDQLPWFFHVFMENLAFALGLPIGVAIQFPWMIFFIAVVLVLVYFIQNVYRPSNRELKRLQSVNDGKVLSLLGEVCKGLQIIRAHKKQNWIREEYISKMNQNTTSRALSESVGLWMEARLLFTGNIIFISTVITCIFFLALKFEFDYTTFAFTMTYAMLVTGSFCNVVNLMCITEQKFVSVERMKQYYENNIQEDIFSQNIGAKEINEDDKILDQQVLDQNDIIFKNIKLSYDNGKSFALKNFNLDIKKHEKIAICGRTGSGKSSILNILFKMYQITSGSIYVKSKEISYYSLKDLRQQMSIIPQFGFLYNASFKDNLDPNEDLKRQDIEKIVQDSGLYIRRQNKNKQNQQPDNQILQIDDDDDDSNSDSEQNEENKSNQEQKIDLEDKQIDEFKNQYKENVDIKVKKLKQEQNVDLDFQIEDGGGNLSNGEKQIINFLRIIMRDKDIICLDEATSNMDPKTDKLLHQKLFEFSKGKTLLVITHRLENIDKFDRVIVLEKGEIVELGHVTELRKNKDGFFNKLINK